jgi:hypothetical protein
MRTRTLLLPLLAGLTTAVTAAGSPTAFAAAPGAHATVEVSTADELEDALAGAVPGETIQLADGIYQGNFETTVQGTADAPITLTGSADAVLTASGGYGLHLDGASYWQVDGVTVTGSQKGIVIDSADGVTIDGVTVHDLDMEGVHFRNSSSNGVIRNSKIYDTGQDGRGMGEGVYVGSAGGVGSDESDHVTITGNTIGPGVGGENIDVKEGTTGTVISGNTFDGSGLTGANYDDSWVDVKGNDVTVENNKGTHTTNDGYQTHSQEDGWGCGTVFRGNDSDLTGSDGPNQLAVDVTNADDDCVTTVSSDNTVTGCKGLTNVDVTDD